VAELDFGDIELFCRGMELFYGKIRHFCKEIGLFCRGIGLSCGKMGLFILRIQSSVPLLILSQALASDLEGRHRCADRESPFPLPEEGGRERERKGKKVERKGKSEEEG